MLRGLSAQTLPPEHWEIFFVDHSSEDGTRQLIEEFGFGRDGFHFITRLENNLANSRQSVVERSRGQWIVFIDSDVVLPPHWLESAWRWAEAQCAVSERFAGVGAPLWIAPKSSELDFVALMQRRFLGHFSTEQMHVATRARRVTHLPTAAALFRKRDLLASGGFHPECGDCGEDLELGERLSRSGAELWIAPELAAQHILSCETKIQWLARAFRFGRARVKIARYHPHMWLQPRLWLPTALAFLQFSLVAWTIVSGQTAGAVIAAALIALDILFSLLSFWSLAKLSPASSTSLAALHTVATHQAYAWGEFCELARTAFALISDRFEKSRADAQFGRLLRRPDRLEAVAMPRTRSGVVEPARDFADFDGGFYHSGSGRVVRTSAVSALESGADRDFEA